MTRRVCDVAWDLLLHYFQPTGERVFLNTQTLTAAPTARPKRLPNPEFLGSFEAEEEAEGGRLVFFGVDRPVRANVLAEYSIRHGSSGM